jgi:hypothetical protein
VQSNTVLAARDVRRVRGRARDRGDDDRVARSAGAPRDDDAVADAQPRVRREPFVDRDRARRGRRGRRGRLRQREGEKKCESGQWARAFFAQVTVSRSSSRDSSSVYDGSFSVPSPRLTSSKATTSSSTPTTSAPTQ